jgi:hypothetical protein
MTTIQIGDDTYETPYKTIEDEVSLCQPIVQAHISYLEYLLNGIIGALDHILDVHDIPSTDDFIDDLNEAKKYINY